MPDFPMTQEISDAFARSREEKKQKMAVRAKVWRAYKDYVMRDGLDPVAAKAKCSERFELSTVQINNVLAHRCDLLPETLADMDATIRVFIGKGKQGVDQTWDEIDERLIELDEMEGAGKTTTTVEVEETTGDKVFTKKKKQPIHEARLKLMERKLEVAGKFMDRLASIAGREAMANAMGKAHLHIHVEADQEFKSQFERLRGFGNEKTVVDATATVVDGNGSNGE